MDHRELTRPATRHAAIIALANAALTSVGYATAFALALDFVVSPASTARMVATLPYLVALRLVLAHRFRLDRGYWRHVGVRDLLRLVACVSLGSLVFPLLLLAVGQTAGVPVTVFALEWMLAIGLSGGVRLLVRTVHERSGSRVRSTISRTFLVGAGETGEQMLRQLQHDRRHSLEVVGLIDDDPDKRGWLLHGIPVLGTADELRGLAALHRVTHALVAIPSATPEQWRRIVTRCLEAGVVAKTLPLLKGLVTEDIRLNHFREVEVDDLLGRKPVELDLEAAAQDIAGKVVLITGAAGSIGSELSRQIAALHPARLLLVDRAESPLYYVHLEIARAHPEVQVTPVLASITNADRMRGVFETSRPDCVFHAAAYKHVPMLEESVEEGVWNNVLGTLRLARAAAAVDTAKFVLISTDKAADPVCVLGATKLVAERLVLELPSLRDATTDFRVVRFGNVLGSEGSVVPLFKRQLASGGPITVTHPEVRRYFMTIPEAVQLVLEAAALPEAAGRIAVLEMGEQVRILELAEQLIRLAGLVPHQDVQIVFTGLRPGEKLAEELLGAGETAQPTTIEKIRVVQRPPFGERTLARRLRDLARAATARDEEGMIRALTALAPTYRGATRSSPRSLAVWPTHRRRIAAAPQPLPTGTYGRA